LRGLLQKKAPLLAGRGARLLLLLRLPRLWVPLPSFLNSPSVGSHLTQRAFQGILQWLVFRPPLHSILVLSEEATHQPVESLRENWTLKPNLQASIRCLACAKDRPTLLVCTI
jgi:hypothetical protein